MRKRMNRVTVGNLSIRLAIASSVGSEGESVWHGVGTEYESNPRFWVLYCREKWEGECGVGVLHIVSIHNILYRMRYPTGSSDRVFWMVVVESSFMISGAVGSAESRKHRVFTHQGAKEGQFAGSGRCKQETKPGTGLSGRRLPSQEARTEGTASSKGGSVLVATPGGVVRCLDQIVGGWGRLRMIGMLRSRGREGLEKHSVVVNGIRCRKRVEQMLAPILYVFDGESSFDHSVSSLGAQLSLGAELELERPLYRLGVVARISRRGRCSPNRLAVKALYPSLCAQPGVTGTAYCFCPRARGGRGQGGGGCHSPCDSAVRIEKDKRSKGERDSEVKRSSHQANGNGVGSERIKAMIHTRTAMKTTGKRERKSAFSTVLMHLRSRLKIKAVRRFNIRSGEGGGGVGL
ncbi:hypothetical protein Tco_0458516 [Tanacetum coccineum]